MSNSFNENDPRLRQDKIERKDKENSSAGMFAGVIIVILAIIALVLYYNYEFVPAVNTTSVTAPQAVPATVPTVPSTNQNLNNNSSVVSPSNNSKTPAQP